MPDLSPAVQYLKDSSTKIETYRGYDIYYRKGGFTIRYKGNVKHYFPQYLGFGISGDYNKTPASETLSGIHNIIDKLV